MCMLWWLTLWFTGLQPTVLTETQLHVYIAVLCVADGDSCLLGYAGKEVYLSQLEQLCVPHSTPTKASTYTYSMF